MTLRQGFPKSLCVKRFSALLDGVRFRLARKRKGVMEVRNCFQKPEAILAQCLPCSAFGLLVLPIFSGNFRAASGKAGFCIVCSQRLIRGSVVTVLP